MMRPMDVLQAEAQMISKYSRLFLITALTLVAGQK